MSHTCHAIGCETPVPPKMFMCKPHWFKLPKPMRDGIWATYKPGQEVSKSPSSSYLHNSMTACVWLAEQEGLGDHGRTKLFRRHLEKTSDFVTPPEDKS